MNKTRYINARNILDEMQKAYPEEKELQGKYFLPDFVTIKETGKDKPFCFVCKLSDKYVIYDGVSNSMYKQSSKKALTMTPMKENASFQDKKRLIAYTDKKGFAVHDFSFCQSHTEAVQEFRNYIKSKNEKNHHTPNYENIRPQLVNGVPSWVLSRTSSRIPQRKTIFYMPIDDKTNIREKSFLPKEKGAPVIEDIKDNQTIIFNNKKVTLRETTEKDKKVKYFEEEFNPIIKKDKVIQTVLFSFTAKQKS